MLRQKFNEYFNQIEREGKEELLAHLEAIGYFTAPASSQYHLAYDGGLLEHSLNVLDVMLALRGNLSLKASTVSIIIVALFHDIGKAAYYGKPNYVENILKSGKRSDAKPYETNKEGLGVPHEVSALQIIGNHIELTEEESHAILFHNGLYTSLGYSLKGKEQPLQTLLHFADMWSSRFLETKGANRNV